MLKTASSLVSLSIAILVAGAVTGCGGAEDVDQALQLLSSDGAAAVTASDQSTDALTDATFDVVASADPTAATLALVAAPAEPVDGKCRTRERDPSDPATVIITLHDCTGRFGRHHVSGVEIVHFSAGEGGVLDADLHSEGLTFDGQPASHTASAEITFSSGARQVVWQGAFDALTDAGEAFTHTSDLTIAVDTTTHCRTRNGSAQTAIGARTIREQHRGPEGVPRRRRRRGLPVRHRGPHARAERPASDGVVRRDGRGDDHDRPRGDIRGRALLSQLTEARRPHRHPRRPPRLTPGPLLPRRLSRRCPVLGDGSDELEQVPRDFVLHEPAVDELARRVLIDLRPRFERHALRIENLCRCTRDHGLILPSSRSHRPAP